MWGVAQAWRVMLFHSFYLNSFEFLLLAVKINTTGMYVSHLLLALFTFSRNV